MLDSKNRFVHSNRRCYAADSLPAQQHRYRHFLKQRVNLGDTAPMALLGQLC